MSMYGGATRKFLEASLTTETNDCIIWPFNLHPKGYPTAQDANGVYRPTRRVCELAYGKAPSLKHHAAHKCGNRACINRRHLEWSLPRENEQHKREHGTYFITPRKLTDDDVRDARRRADAGESYTAIAKSMGVTRGTIRKVVLRLTYDRIN